ncbi:MAG: hypothetical protein HUJ51_04615 [Eggerthellaceae bacterium]|nr:hypothetical protein [Eggerthellaceae bacterium]
MMYFATDDYKDYGLDNGCHNLLDLLPTKFDEDVQNRLNPSFNCGGMLFQMSN